MMHTYSNLLLTSSIGINEPLFQTPNPRADDNQLMHVTHDQVRRHGQGCRRDAAEGPDSTHGSGTAAREPQCI